jgi:hypothetical protein
MLTDKVALSVAGDEITVEHPLFGRIVYQNAAQAATLRDLLERGDAAAHAVVTSLHRQIEDKYVHELLYGEGQPGPPPRGLVPTPA